MPELQPIQQKILLQGERFGTEGEFKLFRHVFKIPTETVGKVDYAVHIVERSENPHVGEVKNTVDGPKQVTLMSGCSTNAEEWFRMVNQLLIDNPSLERVVMLDHPSSGPNSFHERHDGALNTDSFENSAKVAAEALNSLLKQGKIQSGEVFVGLSTGNAVGLELAKRLPDMFSKFFFCAPAGMLNRTPKEMGLGATSGGKEYLLDFFNTKPKRSLERIRQLGKKLKEEKKNEPTTPIVKRYLLGVWEELRDNYFKRHSIPAEKQYPDTDKQPVMMVRSIPDVPEELLHDPAYEFVRKKDLLFEYGFKIGRLFPRFWQHFTGMWGDSMPHVPMDKQPDYKHDWELIAQDTTLEARQAPSGKKIVVVLGMEDGAVPPREFLTEESKNMLAKMPESTLQEQNAKAEKELELIIQGVKGKFPNNKDTKAVLITNGPNKHVSIKVYTELIGSIIARELGSIRAKNTWTQESGWQSGTT